VKFRAVGFISLLTIGLFVAPFVAEAQRAGKVYRVGLLQSAASPIPNTDAFRQRLHELGYREGQNLIIEAPTPKSLEDLPHVAAELARLNVDVILASGTPAATVARDAIATIPVVFVTFADPVGTGLVASVGQPSRNMTGLTMMAAELAGKRLALLKAALPKVTRVAVLWNPANRDTEEQLSQTRAAARSLAIHIDAHAASIPLSDAMFGRERRRIASLAERNRVPGMYHWRSYVEAGRVDVLRAKSD
jgi:putative tryptophan/tyrosine transport system substrate-binding protein